MERFNFQRIDALQPLFSDHNFDHFSQTVFRLFADLGFKGVAIGGVNCDTKLTCVTNFHSEYINTYIANNFAQHDHVIAHCRKYDTPVHWQETYKYQLLSKQSKDIVMTSADFGIEHGIGIPIMTRYGRGLVSLDFDGSARDFNRYLADNFLVIVGLCQSVMWKATTHFTDKVFYTPKLTPREQQCLRYISAGFSNPEIAALLSLSISRIKELVASILKKLHAANRTEAIMQALQTGIITM